MAPTPDLMTLVLEKLDRLDDRLDAQGQTLVRLTATVEEHQRRSVAQEKVAEVMAADLAPIKTHVAVVGGVAKALAAFGMVVSFVFGVLVALRTLGWL